MKDKRTLAIRLAECIEVVRSTKTYALKSNASMVTIRAQIGFAVEWLDAAKCLAMLFEKEVGRGREEKIR